MKNAVEVFNGLGHWFKSLNNAVIPPADVSLTVDEVQEAVPMRESLPFMMPSVQADHWRLMQYWDAGYRILLRQASMFYFFRKYWVNAVEFESNYYGGSWWFNKTTGYCEEVDSIKQWVVLKRMVILSSVNFRPNGPYLLEQMGIKCRTGTKIASIMSLLGISIEATSSFLKEEAVKEALHVLEVGNSYLAPDPNAKTYLTAIASVRKKFNSSKDGYNLDRLAAFFKASNDSYLLCKSVNDSDRGNFTNFEQIDTNLASFSYLKNKSLFASPAMTIIGSLVVKVKNLFSGKDVILEGLGSSGYWRMKLLSDLQRTSWNVLP